MNSNSNKPVQTPQMQFPCNYMLHSDTNVICSYAVQITRKLWRDISVNATCHNHDNSLFCIEFIWNALMILIWFDMSSRRTEKFAICECKAFLTGGCWRKMTQDVIRQIRDS